MRRLPFAVVLLCFTVLAHAQKLGPVDWIFLVDTSKSMRGIGGTRNVFPDVQASLDSFIREANDGDTISLFTFDRDVRLHSSTAIDARARADLHDIVASLPVEGNRTHLGAAIAKGLERAESLRSGADPTRARAVVLFTDGREDIRGIENPIAIEANLPRVGDALVFFVSMGDHEPQLDAFAAATGRTSVLKAPTPEAIRAVTRDIRAKIPPPPPPPPPTTTTTTTNPPPPLPPEKVNPLWYAVPLLLLAFGAAAFIVQRRKQNRLEGELEILRPRPAPDAAFVGLPRLQANEIALSAILPADALAGSDARLFVRRRGGKKKVWIAASGGPLRINDVETPLTELYDADTIDVGGARLRFNRVGDERPEIHQEGEL